MTFCYAPWSNIDISPQGNIMPCCKYQPQDATPNINTHAIVEYFSSAELQQVKQQFENNQWPAGCERCRIEEENNIASKRELDYQRWQEHYQAHDLHSNQLLTASVAFGNTCNLKCTVCGPEASSRWQQEYRDIMGIDIVPNHFYKVGVVEELLEYAPTILHLDIPGGEPFLSGVPQQQKLLQAYVDSGQASQISIHYTTNGTIWPNDSWWDLWSHFREIDMQLSLDGVGSRFEYLRFPANWQEVIHNVTRYQNKSLELANLRLSISHTVSAYNIYYLDEFFAWCEQQHLPEPWCGRVHIPSHARPAVWPQSAREHIADHLMSSTRPLVQVWGNLLRNTNDSEYFEEFKQRTRLHDRYRKLDFSATFPELVRFI
jgi:radical SAM protein with 4Fe4S-binding SPASM domain